MKVLAICGSPRKGNTEFMLKTILGKVKCDKELVLLRNFNIKHCEGSLSCAKLNKCIIKNDDMQKLYKQMQEADIFIFGSPSYWITVTGLFKDFIDRCTPYYYNKKLKDKKAFLVSVGEDKTKEGIKPIIDLMKFFCKELRIKVVGSYIAVGSKADDVSKNKKVIEDLKKIGGRL